MFDSIIAVIAPHNCLDCKAEGALLCQKCVILLPETVMRCYNCQSSSAAGRTCAACRPGRALYAVRPRTDYDATAKLLVAKLKFERARAAARDIAHALPVPPAEAKHERLIVHVPTATGRVRQRGYDQAQLIAWHYARRHGLTQCTALARHGQQRQLGGSGAMRRQQLAGAFRVTCPLRIAGKHIILVDDVMTTGASLAAAAQALKTAGAWRVEAVVFARA